MAWLQHGLAYIGIRDADIDTSMGAGVLIPAPSPPRDGVPSGAGALSAPRLRLGPGTLSSFGPPTHPIR